MGRGLDRRHSLALGEGTGLVDGLPLSRSTDAEFKLLFDPFLDFFHEVHIFLGLQPFCLFVENFHLFDLMSGQFELVFEVVVFVFEDLSFLEDPFSFDFVLFLADLFIQPILLKSQGMDMVDYLFELVVLILALLLELQLGVE